MKFYNVVSRLRRVDPELGWLIGAVCFGDDTYSVPLQAADILANLTYKWFIERRQGMFFWMIDRKEMVFAFPNLTERGFSFITWDSVPPQ